MLEHRRVFLGFAFCVAALAASWLALGARAQRNDPRDDPQAAEGRWEYLVVAQGNVSLSPTGSPGERKQTIFSSEASTVERNLDVLGKDGWELVAVAGTPNQPAFFLKRPLRKK